MREEKPKPVQLGPNDKSSVGGKKPSVRIAKSEEGKHKKRKKK